MRKSPEFALAAASILFVPASFGATPSLFLSVDHLGAATGFDNAPGDADITGQTFAATEETFVGVRVQIGAELPNLTLEGPADLVLFDAADLSAPVEIARAQVVPKGQVISGQQDLLLLETVATERGRRYFFGLDTNDVHGIGLRDSFTSTYPAGREAFLSAGIISEGESGRDLTFGVYSVASILSDGFESGDLAAWTLSVP